MLVLEENAHIVDNAAHAGRLCNEVLVEMKQLGDGEVEELFILAAQAGHHLLPVRQTRSSIEHLQIQACLSFDLSNPRQLIRRRKASIMYINSTHTQKFIHKLHVSSLINLTANEKYKAVNFFYYDFGPS